MFTQADLEALVGQMANVYVYEIGAQEGEYDELVDAKITKATPGALHLYIEEYTTTYNEESKEWERTGEVNKFTQIIPYERIAEILIYAEEV